MDQDEKTRTVKSLSDMQVIMVALARILDHQSTCDFLYDDYAKSLADELRIRAEKQ